MGLLDSTQPDPSMGIFQPQSSMPKFKGIMDFLSSPQALSLAAGLMQAGAPSRLPVTFGQGFAQGIQNMQTQTNNDINNQYKKALTSQLQNSMLMEQRRQASMNKMLQGLMTGQQGGAQTQAPVGSGMTIPQAPSMPAPMAISPMVDPLEKGVQNAFAPINAPDGSQLPDINPQPAPMAAPPQQQGLDQKTAAQAGLLLMKGDYDKAFELMNGGKYERPVAVIGADGRQHLIQVSDRGAVKQINGVTPIVKNGTQLSIDPATGQVLFQQGMTDTDLSGLVKDPSKSPARGGQGGVYVDPKTGKTIVTNTPKNQTQDQTTISSMQRVTPQIDTLLKVMPQFQSATTQAQKGLEGFSNKYFGTNFSLPSEFATGQAQLAAAPEALMKAYGLNVTDESLKTMRQTIQPMSGESPQGYKNRILETLVHLKSMEGQAKSRIADGMVVRDTDTSNAPTEQPGVRTYNLKTGGFE